MISITGKIMVGSTPVFVFTFLDQNGAAMDISQADELNVYLTAPNGGQLKKQKPDVAFVTDGTDGKIQYQCATANLSTPGKGWKVEAEAIKTGIYTWRQPPECFEVEQNIF